MDCSTPDFPVLHYCPEFVQTHVHWVSDAIQPSHPLSSPSAPALNLSQHQGLFQWLSSSHQVAKVLEFQLQHQSFQWIFRMNWLDLLAVQGTLKSLLQHHSSKASILWGSAFYMVQLSHTHMTRDGPLLAKWRLCFLICCQYCYDISSRLRQAPWRSAGLQTSADPVARAHGESWLHRDPAVGWRDGPWAGQLATVRALQRQRDRMQLQSLRDCGGRKDGKERGWLEQLWEGAGLLVGRCGSSIWVGQWAFWEGQTFKEIWSGSGTEPRIVKAPPWPRPLKGDLWPFPAWAWLSLQEGNSPHNSQGSQELCAGLSLSTANVGTGLALGLLIMIARSPLAISIRELWGKKYKRFITVGLGKYLEWLGPHTEIKVRETEYGPAVLHFLGLRLVT